MSMNTPNDGGPAFPFGQVSELTGQPINGFFNPGMSLRDWLAGKAMAAIIAKTPYQIHQSPSRDEALQSEVLQVAATGAYLYADAMLAARDGKEGA